MNNIRILFVTMEVYPFSKAGGIGDTSIAFPKVLRKRSIDIRIISPKYNFFTQELLNKMNCITEYDVQLGNEILRCKLWMTVYDGVPAYFIENSVYFERDLVYGYKDSPVQAIFLAKAVLEALPYIQFQPDIIHCNDWYTAMIPLLLKTKYNNFIYYREIKTLFMIHSFKHHGIGNKDLHHLLGVDWDFFVKNGIDQCGKINFIKAGAVFFDRVITVSPSYAKEINCCCIENQLFYNVLLKYHQEIKGILCGLDVEKYNPASDPMLFSNYDAEHLEGKKINKKMVQQILGLPVLDVPIIGWVSRLDEAKGINLVQDLSPYLAEENAQYIICGDGLRFFKMFFQDLSAKYPTKFKYCEYDETLAHRIYAGSDIFILPSQFEPCGLSQQISMRYGTVPIVRATGGLKDTVTEFDETLNTGTGFLFKNYNSWAFLFTIRRAISYYWKDDLWKIIIKNCMRRDCSWDPLLDEYINLYKEIIS